jgi:hypothetical protein
LAALITGSATLAELSYGGNRSKHPNNKTFDKLGVYSKSPKVADAMIEAQLRLCNSCREVFLAG